MPVNNIRCENVEQKHCNGFAVSLTNNVRRCLNRIRIFLICMAYMRLNLIGCLRLSLTRSLESEPAISTDAQRLEAFANSLYEANMM